MDELRQYGLKKRCYDLGGSGGDDSNLWWVESVGVVTIDDSLALISSLLLFPWDDRIGLLPFDPEVGMVSAVASCGEDTILENNVWAGLGGGVGGVSLLPGDDVFMLK